MQSYGCHIQKGDLDTFHMNFTIKFQYSYFLPFRQSFDRSRNNVRKHMGLTFIYIVHSNKYYQVIMRSVRITITN